MNFIVQKKFNMYEIYEQYEQELIMMGRHVENGWQQRLRNYSYTSSSEKLY